jgi:co-chaperonin GroES (HSP10)
MKISPKRGILLIKKHKKTQIKEDIIVEESEEDKRLITGEVMAVGIEYDNEECSYSPSPSMAEGRYPVGITVIFGKYAIFPLTFQGKEYHFLDENDVIGVCDYKEE